MDNISKDNYRVLRLLRNGDKYDYITKLTLPLTIDCVDNLINFIKQHINKKYSISGFRLFNYQGLDFSETDLDSVKETSEQSMIFYALKSK